VATSVSVGCFHRFGYAAERFRVLFRLWLLSILQDQDVWVYLITQVTGVILEAGITGQLSVFVIQVMAIALVFVSNVIYLFVVHLAAWFLLDRLEPDPLDLPIGFQWIMKGN